MTKDEAKELMSFHGWRDFGDVVELVLAASNSGANEERERLARLPVDLVSTDGLGPLPEADMSHRKALDDCDEETSYSAEAMEVERQRCYAMGVADGISQERNRCRYPQ